MISQTIDEIKHRLDIVDVVQEYIDLDRKGSIYKALCPFHSERDPSFVVFPDSQRWQCFGSCDEGGDLIDFVQRHQGVDLIEAVRTLARRANVQMPEYDETAQRAYKKKRDYQEGLGVAAGFFIAQIKERNAGRAYARKRGLSDEVIDSGLLGYAPEGGLEALLGHFGMHEMAADSRAAQVARKIQGFAYHKGGALVYVHRRHGRVVYLSARAIRPEVEAHESKYNPPRKLAGERRAFVVGKPLKRAESILVVEGQACAVTAGAEWEAVDTAVAIAGADLEDEELLERMVDARRVYIGLDDDETGRRHRGELAERLGALTRVVTWPQKDANDLQRIAAGTREAPEGFEVPEDVGAYVARLLRDAPSWLDLCIEEYNSLEDPQERAEMSEEIAALYGDLPQPIRVQLKDDICARMGIGKRDLDHLVKSVWEKRLSNIPYATKWGMLCRQNGLQEDGTPKWTPVASFDARVTREVIHDNGIERDIHFVIEGALNDGTPLPTITVEAEEYPAMRWCTGLWGAKAYPMEASPHHLRRGILELSDPDQQTRYTHTGWRKVNGGQRVFLFNGGAVGADGVDVDVELDDSRLQGYVLEAHPEAVTEAMQASLRYLELTDLRITGPLWAAMYLAPLSEIIEPDFVPFIYGKTGAMKSTITALALNHFGAGWNYNRMPASWTDTVTSLEMKSFAAKDVPLVVDDYARDVLNARSQDRKAQRMIRAWGNRANRARRKSDLSAQKNFPPRGLAIVSGEQLPSGQSIIGRLLPIEVRRDDLVDNEAAMARLNACQAERRKYPHAMSAFLLWVRERWDDLKEELPNEWERLRDHQRFTEMTHQRIPAVIAKLYCGFDLAMKFAVAQSAIEQEEAQQWRNRFFDALLEDALDHSILVEEEDPIDRFVRIIRDDVAQGKIWFEGTGDIADMPVAGDRTPYAEKLGFVDQDWLYVFGESTLSYIQQRCRQTGDPFPLNRNALYSGLTEANIAVPGSQYTTMQYKGPGGQNHRVLKLYANEFGIEPQEEGAFETEDGEPEPVEF